MRGGQYLNNWRMAELPCERSPERVNELESWGALFDRTKDGKILQRNFGGHKYPRLAHVGDRTGLEMIRTLQDHGIHQGIDVHMECTITTLLKDGDRVIGAFGYERERGRFQNFPGEKPSSLPQEGSEEHIRSPVIAGNIQVMVIRWLIMQVQSW
jgi:succinate dehydrogenase / fumarate reductase flavoprotein subunit